MNDENSELIATVPKSWICYVKNQMVCKWPPNNNSIYGLIKKMVQPTVTWKGYPCQVFKEFDDYLVARKYERKLIELESSDTDISSSLKGKGHRKKIPKRRTTDEITDADSYTDDDSPWERQLRDMEAFEAVEEEAGAQNTDNNCGNVQQNAEVTVEVGLDDPVMLGEQTIIYEQNNDTLVKLTELEIKITALNEKVDRLLLLFHNTNSVSTENQEILELPLKTINELEEFEEKLKNPKYCASLGNLFTLIGGVNSQKLIRRCLMRVFSDNLASECSFTGAKNNFKIKGLTIIREIQRVVQHLFPSTSEYEIERVTMDFFRYARQRQQRRSVSC